MDADAGGWWMVDSGWWVDVISWASWGSDSGERDPWIRGRRACVPFCPLFPGPHHGWLLLIHYGLLVVLGGWAHLLLCMSQWLSDGVKAKADLGWSSQMGGCMRR